MRRERPLFKNKTPGKCRKKFGLSKNKTLEKHTKNFLSIFLEAEKGFGLSKDKSLEKNIRRERAHSS